MQSPKSKMEEFENKMDLKVYNGKFDCESLLSFSLILSRGRSKRRLAKLQLKGEITKPTTLTLFPTTNNLHVRKTHGVRSTQCWCMSLE